MRSGVVNTHKLELPNVTRSQRRTSPSGFAVAGGKASPPDPPARASRLRVFFVMNCRPPSSSSWSSSWSSRREPQAQPLISLTTFSFLSYVPPSAASPAELRCDHSRVAVQPVPGPGDDVQAPFGCTSLTGSSRDRAGELPAAPFCGGIGPAAVRSGHLRYTASVADERLCVKRVGRRASAPYHPSEALPRRRAGGRPSQETHRGARQGGPEGPEPWRSDRRPPGGPSQSSNPAWWPHPGRCRVLGKARGRGNRRSAPSSWTSPEALATVGLGALLRMMQNKQWILTSHMLQLHHE